MFGDGLVGVIPDWVVPGKVLARYTFLGPGDGYLWSGTIRAPEP